MKLTKTCSLLHANDLIHIYVYICVCIYTHTQMYVCIHKNNVLCVRADPVHCKLEAYKVETYETNKNLLFATC
jgi:hypothetical protein